MQKKMQKKKMDSLLRVASIILDMSGGFVWLLEDHDLHSRRYAIDYGRGLNKVHFPSCCASLTSLPKMVSGFNHFQRSCFDEDECDLLKAVNIGKVILALAGVTIVQSLIGPP